MLDYLEYLNLPTKVSIALVGLFLILQIGGELLEFQGKVVPEYIKIRKYFIRKREESKTIHQIPQTLSEVQHTLEEFKSYYNDDNISKRDKWIENVNHKLEQNDEYIKKLDEKLNRNNEDTLSLLIDSKKNLIINFAQYVIDEKNPVTREQFNRVFKVYREYEELLIENDKTNGEVDIAIRIIKEAYEKHMRNHTFIENIRGYDNF